MSRRLFVPLLAALLVIAALGAVAAVKISEAPSVTVVPELYKSGEEGYFRIVAKLPKGASKEYLSLVPQVEEGDLFLITMRPVVAKRVEHTHAADDDAEQGQPGQIEDAVTIIGRYLKPGPARLTLYNRASKGKLLRLAFSLPGGDVTADATIRTEWAQQYQWSLWASDPNGEDRTRTPSTGIWQLPPAMALYPAIWAAEAAPAVRLLTCTVSLPALRPFRKRCNWNC
jgi:hypothetical protein